VAIYRVDAREPQPESAPFGAPGSGA
jgi:hypothetical protein